jgi:malonyl-CoA O-methyltransferase
MKTAIQRCFSRASSQYDNHSFFQKKVADQLMEFLREGFIPLSHPSSSTREEVKSKDCSTFILDVGCGTGYSSLALSHLFPDSKILGLDLSFPQCQQASDKYPVISADFDHLPFRKASIDVIFSSLSLQWSLNFHETAKHFAQVLAPGGLLVFSTLGAGTLHELTQAKKLSSTKTLPENLLSHPFLPLSETLAALKSASFTVMSKKRQSEVFWFQHPLAVLKSLKAVGANYLSSANIGLSTKKSLETLIANYQVDPITNQYPMTYEVDYLIAKKELHNHA